MSWSIVSTTSSPATGGTVSDLAETISLPWGSVCIAIDPALPDSTESWVDSNPARPWASVPVKPMMCAASWPSGYTRSGSVIPRATTLAAT